MNNAIKYSPTNNSIAINIDYTTNKINFSEDEDQYFNGTITTKILDWGLGISIES